MHATRVIGAVIAVVLAPGVARAGHDETTFAQSFDVAADHVHGVVHHDLPSGGDYTRVLVGFYDEGKYRFAGAVLLRCDQTTCQGTRAGFSASASIEVLGLVDLNGEPAAFPTGHLGGGSRIPGKLGKWPALVIATTDVTTEPPPMTGTSRSGRTAGGAERHVRMHLVSLASADRGQQVLSGDFDEHYPSGGGTTTTYRLVRGDSKTALDVIATEQRDLDDRHSHCLRPKPTELRYKLDGRHYRAVGLPVRTGC